MVNQLEQPEQLDSSWITIINVIAALTITFVKAYNLINAFSITDDLTSHVPPFLD